ncbi:NAD(P)-dependent oxidoreductase [Nonomuraea cavernae]|uniref:2-hydroxyacid dehydrogenase n=1 Tax=Nonomuraea cavernae TaxID=2045107 RepID=A0A917YN74_9ACTN|nr:NAD(P)-dependent oxidoreductase [Nonomuraea cavernae]MCA2183666.1 hypothetical protein [Nonomuraea cavernae]GGO60994.1 2-hydroxyacid dehydrogenase [Nonomuraea cavernae]
MKRVHILGRTNLSPTDLGKIGAVCRLVTYDHNVPPDATAEVIRRAEAAEIIVVNAFTPLSKEVVAELPRLRTIISCSSGIDHVDIAACGEAGVNLRWFPGFCARTVAEKTLAFILMGLNHLVPAIDNVRQGRWDYLAFQGREARGRRVAIIGHGAIGRILADLCDALGFAVSTVNSRTPEPEVKRVIAAAHIISLHLDLNATTRHFLDQDTCALFQKDVVVVNTARGELIDDDALVRHLTANPASSAFLDATTLEPMPADHPYRSLPNVVVTPHTAWNSAESDAYLARETFVAVMMAIDSGWTTHTGEAGYQLLGGRLDRPPLS